MSRARAMAHRFFSHWRLLLVAIAVPVAAIALRRFPWQATWAALAGADALLLAVAVVVNLVSLVAKGWEWQLLLCQAAPCRWRTAQEANLAGAAVNNVSVSVVGEAARLQYVVSREDAPAATVAASIVAARAVEGVALGIFLVTAPFALHLTPMIKRIQLGAVLVLAVVLLLFLWRRGRSLPPATPGILRRLLEALGKMGSPRRLIWPLVLALVNWATQWATFLLVLAALHLSSRADTLGLAASFTALVVTNLSGMLRLLPANVGIFQAAMSLALLPFGIAAEQSVAGGLALQAIQVLPVLLLGSLVVGWRGLVRRERSVSP